MNMSSVLSQNSAPSPAFAQTCTQVGLAATREAATAIGAGAVRVGAGAVRAGASALEASLAVGASAFEVGASLLVKVGVPLYNNFASSASSAAAKVLPQVRSVPGRLTQGLVDAVSQ